MDCVQNKKSSSYLLDPPHRPSESSFPLCTHSFMQDLQAIYILNKPDRKITPSTDLNFMGVNIWEFCSKMSFWGARAIFPIFHNGQHQLSISVNTWKTGDRNFRGLVVGNFALG